MRLTGLPWPRLRRRQLAEAEPAAAPLPPGPCGTCARGHHRLCACWGGPPQTWGDHGHALADNQLCCWCDLCRPVGGMLAITTPQPGVFAMTLHVPVEQPQGAPAGTSVKAEALAEAAYETEAAQLLAAARAGTGRDWPTDPAEAAAAERWREFQTDPRGAYGQLAPEALAAEAEALALPAEAEGLRLPSDGIFTPDGRLDPALVGRVAHVLDLTEEGAERSLARALGLTRALGIPDPFTAADTAEPGDTAALRTFRAHQRAWCDEMEAAIVVGFRGL